MCIYSVKKAFPYSLSQPWCHLPNSPWAGIMTSYIIYSRLGRVWKVTSWLGTGILKSFFYGVGCKVNYGVVFARSVSYMHGEVQYCCGIPLVVYLRGLAGSFPVLWAPDHKAIQWNLQFCLFLSSIHKIVALPVPAARKTSVPIDQRHRFYFPLMVTIQLPNFFSNNIDHRSKSLVLIQWQIFWCSFDRL